MRVLPIRENVILGGVDTYPSTPRRIRTIARQSPFAWRVEEFHTEVASGGACAQRAIFALGGCLKFAAQS